LCWIVVGADCGVGAAGVVVGDVVGVASMNGDVAVVRYAVGVGVDDVDAIGCDCCDDGVGVAIRSCGYVVANHDTNNHIHNTTHITTTN